MILYVLQSKQERFFGPDFTIWMDTIKEGRYEDTNKLFENPKDYNFRITEWNEMNHINLAEEINKNVLIGKKPTVQMLGRWQPWHAGHQELFKRAIKKTGQVIIQVRDVYGASGGDGQEDNPFDWDLVCRQY